MNYNSKLEFGKLDTIRLLSPSSAIWWILLIRSFSALVHWLAAQNPFGYRSACWETRFITIRPLLTHWRRRWLVSVAVRAVPAHRIRLVALNRICRRPLWWMSLVVICVGPELSDNFFGNRISLRDEPLDGSGVVLAEIIQLRDSAMAAMTFGEKNRLLTVDGSMQISTPPRGI